MTYLRGKTDTYRKTLFLIVLLVTAIFPRNSWCLNGADVAIYNDTFYPGGGAWREGLDAIKAMLSTYGYTYEEITPYHVNSAVDLNSLYKVVIFGGGWAGGYNEYIKKFGYMNIRKFIANGGGYLGICAGSYFAADRVLWKPDFQTAMEAYDYPLDLFSGIGGGVVLAIKPWTAPTGCSSGITEGAAMTPIDINVSILPDVGSDLNMLYYGGPVFFPYPFSDHNIEVLGTYRIPGAPADGAPAMIMFSFGKGKVFLSGPHPEISFDAGTCSFHYDNDSWYFMSRILSILMGKK